LKPWRRFGGDKGIVYALGKLVERMTEKGFWIHYSIVMPKSYYELLKDFEVGGFQTLKLHPSRYFKQG